MLTLLLVLGAVTCSPVPSDLPAIPDAAHIEVTHEVRQVTYEVSAEVNEATASSHIPSDVSPEEDPPIPTVTTPHTAPEEQQHHTHDATVESEVAPEPLEPESEISQEASTQHEITAVKSLQEENNSDEKKTEVDLEENVEEPLPSSEATETENVSDSEPPREAIVRSSSETLELVPESQIFLSKEDVNDSQPEAAADELPIDTSSVTVNHEDEEVSVLPTNVDSEVTDTAHNEPEQRNVEHAIHETEDSVEKEVESASITDTGNVQEHSDPTVETVEHGGEELPEIPPQVTHEAEGSEFLEAEKRTDNDDLPVHEEVAEEPVSENPEEDVGVVAPEENIPETTRESRVYVDYEDEESTESRERKEEHTIPEEDKSHVENESKPANDGLQSMSMTSPTPESLSDTVPIIDDLEKEEAPPAEDQETEDATILPEMESQEENSTLITDAEDPDVVPEVVINPPSSSIAPLPVEEYTDNYGDPLHFGDLPDFDVTHEHLPSKDHPLPKDAKLIPKHEHTGEVNKGESSDLAAGDHMLEIEAGTPRVLPPQQEQVSAAAPSALTPGCIVAIVFGVLVSLVVILGVGGFMIWQRRTQNRPKVLGNDQGYAGSDSGGYIDDQVRVSYVNSQTDTPKGSPEDLISLDNDSFLNSLESMTIQNLWTDNIRHTKL